jgi:hypothetical protein
MMRWFLVLFVLLALLGSLCAGSAVLNAIGGRWPQVYGQGMATVLLLGGAALLRRRAFGGK